MDQDETFCLHTYDNTLYAERQKNVKNKDQKTFQARGIYLRKKMYKNNAKNIDTLIFIKSHFSLIKSNLVPSKNMKTHQKEV